MAALVDPAVKKDVLACLGSPAASYLANKVRGGSSGRKGTRYEDFFAAYQVAKCAVEKLQGDAEWPEIQEQVVAFVDDLLISRRDSTSYFQLKNVDTLSWSAGDHPLVTDFSNQKVLSDYQGEPGPLTSLVVSSSNVLEKLGIVPSSIATHSDVIHFPYGEGRINRLIQEYEPLCTTLKHLARTADVPLDALEGILGVLIIGLMRQDGQKVSVEDVVKAARAVSPSLIRLFPEELEQLELDASFVAILASIPGFVYRVDRGFFEWSYGDTSGVSSADCLTEDFRRLQTRVVSKSPDTFEELEELL